MRVIRGLDSLGEQKNPRRSWYCTIHLFQDSSYTTIEIHSVISSLNNLHSTILPSKNIIFILSTGALKKHVIEKSTVDSLVECGLKCASLLPDCKSINYVTKQHGSAICEINNSSKSDSHKDEFVQQHNSEYFEAITDENQDDSPNVNQVCMDVCVCACG